MKKSTLILIILLMTICFNVNQTFSKENVFPQDIKSLNTNYNQNIELYLKEIQDTIQKNWLPPQSYKTKNTIVKFTIGRNGELLSLNLDNTSKNDIIDKAALDAIRVSEPFNPLPKDFKDDTLDIEYVFNYNVWKSSNKKLDFNTYLSALKKRLFLKWDLLGVSRALKTSIVFTINMEGKLLNPQVLYSSGNKQFDELALITINKTSPFYCLPPCYQNKNVEIRATFYFNNGPSIYLTQEKRKDKDITNNNTSEVVTTIAPDIDVETDVILDKFNVNTNNPVLKESDQLAQLFDKNWRGELVTPNSYKMNINLKNIENDRFIGINNIKYPVYDFEFGSNKIITFYILMDKNDNSKLSFEGKLSDTNIKGIVFDIKGKEGYWFLRNND